MNDFLNKLERKYGKYAIRDLSKYIIGCYVIGYVLYAMTRLGSNAINLITLDPYKILHGQIWRIVTWILVPPAGFNIFTIIMLLFYYSLGTNLERSWGTFRYNVYIFSGMLFTVVSTLVFYVVGVMVFNQIPEYLGAVAGSVVSTYYINLSIFLAFATSYPDMQIMLYFIIPLKIKWLAYFDIVITLIDIVFPGGMSATVNWAKRITILASLLNFALYFFTTRNYKYVSPKEVHRRKDFRQQVRNSNTVTKHKCAICGRTENDGDDLEFRFCSKCNGNYEYCQDHLFTHTHIQ